MTRPTVRHSLGALLVPLGLMTLAGVPVAGAQTAAAAEQPKPWLNLYGFVQLDMIYDAGQMDPDWYDVLHPTKLPSFEDQFGEDGSFWASVRQTRAGVTAGTPTSLGEVASTFEFDLYGTGSDAGQTTFRLRHAYLELGQFGAGQTWSPFMDSDVYPGSLEYWGPPGMAALRNVQVRWMPIQGLSRLTFALERPGASVDAGDYDDRVELQNVKARFPYPDVSGEYRYGADWGHVEVAGIVRWMEWVDVLDDQYELGGSAVGWGVSLSSNLKLGQGGDVVRLQVVYGEGIENHMNDAPADLGVENNFGDPVRPIKGQPLPVTGIVAFLDHTWNDRWSSTVGYSSVDIDNSDGQAPSAFKKGQCALVNLLFRPVMSFMLGGEVKWGRRVNYSDGWSVDDLRLQFSVKANFSKLFGGKP